MSIISIRLNEEEEAICEYAKIHNMKPAVFMKKIVLDYLEDEYDIERANTSLKQVIDHPKSVLSFEDMVKSLNLEKNV